MLTAPRLSAAGSNSFHRGTISNAKDGRQSYDGADFSPRDLVSRCARWSTLPGRPTRSISSSQTLFAAAAEPAGGGWPTSLPPSSDCAPRYSRGASKSTPARTHRQAPDICPRRESRVSTEFRASSSPSSPRIEKYLPRSLNDLQAPRGTTPMSPCYSLLHGN
jgi:hypothetical protein